jgi:hypothetical protein
MPKTDTTELGFTTDYFGRCALCETPLDGGLHCPCCRVHVFHVDPQPKQRQLIDMCLETGLLIAVALGIGGARGAAKSRAMRDAILVIVSELCRRYPGLVIYLVRQNLGDLFKNHVNRYYLEHPPMKDWFYNGQQEKGFIFPDSMGGLRLLLGYGDTPKDLERFTRGPEALFIFVDQAEAFSEDELGIIRTPNRWPGAEPGMEKMIYGFNPGGPGIRYLARVFAERNFKLDRERPERFAFIQSYGWDNYHGWFAGQGIEIDGRPLDRELFYSLPGDMPELPKNGKFDAGWLASIPDNHRFKLFVTKTTEGIKMWEKPDSVRMGELFGRFDSFEGQCFAGIWNEAKVVLR